MLTYSFFYPGKWTTIDSIRLPIQAKIMAKIGNYLLSDFYIDGELVEGSPNAMTKNQLEKYINSLSPGNIFFTDSENYVSSEFIPGKRKHAVIYLGSQKQTNNFFKGNELMINFLNTYYKIGDEKLIIDSSSHGVAIREYQELSNIKKVSFLIALSSFKINRTKKDITTFLTYAIRQVGKNYDYDMITDNDTSLYCSELIYEALKQIDIVLNIKQEIYGREIILPSDVVKYITTEGIPSKEFKFMFFIEKENNLVQEQPLKILEQ
ncbi:MAG: YiiX/YebB-like N1pC/P60 family cysteine hydrolase [bacterium]